MRWPLLIVLLVVFRSYFVWRRKRDLKNNVIRDRDTFCRRVVEGFHDFVLLRMPVALHSLLTLG